MTVIKKLFKNQEIKLTNTSFEESAFHNQEKKYSTTATKNKLPNKQTKQD